MQDVKKKVEEKIDKLIKEGIKAENLDLLYKLVDIHKDIENEKYWKIKEEEIDMRYRFEDNYGNEYGRRGVPGTGRRYRDYGARGYDTKYKGEEIIGDMHDMYKDYSDAREEMNMGNYGAEQETIKSFEYMLKSFKDFFKHLKKEANSQEEIEMLQKTAREISQM